MSEREERELAADEGWFACRRCEHQFQLKRSADSENVLTRTDLAQGKFAFICPQCRSTSRGRTNRYQFGRHWCAQCCIFMQQAAWRADVQHRGQGGPNEANQRARYLCVYRHRDREGWEVPSALDQAPILADNNNGGEQNTAPTDATNENLPDDAHNPSDNNTGGDSNNIATASSDVMNTSAFDDGLSAIMLQPAFKCAPFEVYCGDPEVTLKLILNEPRAVARGATTSATIELSDYPGRSVIVVCKSLETVVQPGQVRNDPVFYEFNARKLFEDLSVPDTHFDADVTLELLRESSEASPEQRCLRFRKTPNLDDSHKLARIGIELQRESNLPSNESTTSDSPNAAQHESSSTGQGQGGVHGYSGNGTHNKSAVLWRSEFHLIFAARPLLANTIAAGRHDLIEQLKAVATKCDYRLLLHEIVETQLARVVATVFAVQWNSATIERSARRTCLVDNILGFIRSVEVCAADAQSPRRQCCAADNFASMNYGVLHVLEYLGCDFSRSVKIDDWASRSITGWMRSKLRLTDVSETYEGVPDQANDVLDISSRNAAAALASKTLQTSDDDDDAIDWMSTQSIVYGRWNRPSYEEQQQEFERHKQDVLAGKFLSLNFESAQRLPGRSVDAIRLEPQLRSRCVAEIPDLIRLALSNFASALAELRDQLFECILDKEDFIRVIAHLGLVPVTGRREPPPLPGPVPTDVAAHVRAHARELVVEACGCDVCTLGEELIDDNSTRKQQRIIDDLRAYVGERIRVLERRPLSDIQLLAVHYAMGPEISTKDEFVAHLDRRCVECRYIKYCNAEARLLDSGDALPKNVPALFFSKKSALRDRVAAVSSPLMPWGLVSMDFDIEYDVIMMPCLIRTPCHGLRVAVLAYNWSFKASRKERHCTYHLASFIDDRQMQYIARKSRHWLDDVINLDDIEKPLLSPTLLAVARKAMIDDATFTSWETDQRRLIYFAFGGRSPDSRPPTSPPRPPRSAGRRTLPDVSYDDDDDDDQSERDRAKKKRYPGAVLFANHA